VEAIILGMVELSMSLWIELSNSGAFVALASSLYIPVYCSLYPETQGCYAQQ